MISNIHVMNMKFSHLARALCVILALGFWSDVKAQIPGLTPAPQPSEAPGTTEPAPPVAPDSPRASLESFLEAADAGRWADAANYLSLARDQRSRGEDLAKRLKSVLDRHWIDLETVSAEAGGRRDDGLPPELEEVRPVVPIGPKAEPMRLVRRSDAKGAFWAFSPATVARIDAWYAALPERWLGETFGLDGLLRPGPFDILRWQWIALPLLALVAWALSWGLAGLTRWIFGHFRARTATVWRHELLASIGPPLTLAWAIIVFSVGVVLMQLTRSAYWFFHSMATAGLVFAFFWGLWRSIGVLSKQIRQLSWAARSPWVRNLLAVGNNLARGAIVAFGVLAVLSAFGFPIGTLLAGLGIGGLALAFGAQKTVENLFGSVSLAVDQPFRVGDFVKVDDFVGTVEDIGLRSTRFRTLDRTLITIPNGKLADQRLESFAVRDRMRLAATLGVTYSTTRSQMQTVLEGFERVLREHPWIWPEAMVVRFKEFGPSSLDIEVMAWFQVPTWGDFQLCRQEVLLAFMQVVEDAGTSFAFPTRTVHVVNENAARPVGSNVQVS
jgi:MscS family membrane protein